MLSANLWFKVAIYFYKAHFRSRNPLITCKYRLQSASSFRAGLSGTSRTVARFCTLPLQQLQNSSRNFVFMATAVDTLPLSSVAAAAKVGLPAGASLSKDAKLILQRAAGLFILQAAGAANDACRSSKRSTVSAADVTKALHDTDMAELAEPVEVAIAAFRADVARSKKSKAAPAPKRARRADEEASESAAAAAPEDSPALNLAEVAARDADVAGAAAGKGEI